MSHNKSKSQFPPPQKRHSHYEELIDQRIGGGKSGYDVVATLSEFSYGAGVFLRKLILGQVRTRNPFLLLLMIGTGVLCTLPAISWFYTAITQSGPSNPDWLTLAAVTVVLIFGSMWLYNAVMSILQSRPGTRARSTSR